MSWDFIVTLIVVAIAGIVIAFIITGKDEENYYIIDENTFKEFNRILDADKAESEE